MNIFPYLYLVALAGAVLALILWPLLKGAAPGQERAETDDRSDLARLREQRDVALQAIQDLDKDLSLGNLTAEEHKSLRARAVRQAALLIREIDGREQVLDAEIEAALQRRRKRATAASVRQHKQGDTPSDRHE